MGFLTGLSSGQSLGGSLMSGFRDGLGVMADDNYFANKAKREEEARQSQALLEMAAQVSKTNPEMATIAQAAAKTGSGETLLKLAMNALGLDLPADVREWKYYDALSPADQERYLLMKRSNPFVDLGGSMMRPSPVTGAPLVSYDRTLRPEDTPHNAAAKANATKGGEALAAMGRGVDSFYQPPVQDAPAQDVSQSPLVQFARQFLLQSTAQDPMAASRQAVQQQRAALGTTDNAPDREQVFLPDTLSPLDPQDIGQQFPSAAEVAAATKTAEIAAQNKGETSSELGERMATFPQLVNTVRKLSELGKTATYTKAGRIGDFIRNEFSGITGLVEPSQSSIDMDEYVSLVDNQILPLLRQTFGTAFTQKEGESLKTTLGDPYKTPESKDAVLRSFIRQKIETINSKERQLGLPPTQFPSLDEIFKGGGKEEDPIEAELRKRGAL